MGSKLLALLLWLAVAPAWAGLDTGQGIFFPPSLARRIEAYTSFPLTWWNFFTFELKDDSELPYLRESCRQLRQQAGADFALLACGEDLRGFEPLLRDWARDIAIRQDMPEPASLVRALEQAMARASLPLPHEMLQLLRFDPLGAYRELKSRLESRSPIQLSRRDGFFIDEQARRVLIPVKLSYPPQEEARTAHVLAALQSSCGERETCSRWAFLGPHGSTFTNQQTVHSDVSRVSAIGTSLLVLGLLFLALSGRARLLLLAPVVGIGVGLSALVTLVVFGSLHGLTIAFGSSIVGLALDYGLHRALNEQRYVSRSNLFGLLTTVGALLVLLPSTIPLVRQLMFFSALGLVTAFALIELLYRRSRLLHGIRSFPLTPSENQWGVVGGALLLLGALLGAVFLHPSFELAKFNFQTARERELMIWLAKRANLMPPLFTIDREGYGEEKLARAHAAVKAGEGRYRVENAAALLPPMEEQRRHLATWLGFPCREGETQIVRFGATLTTTQQQFFEPFFESLTCAKAGRPDVDILPAYAADYESRGSWLTLYFPSDAKGTAEVKEDHPDATSLREVVEIFPATLSSELRWMVPASLLLIFLLLTTHFRHPGWALLSMVPFFTAVGFFCWLVFLFKLDVSFVTLIGMVMLCGLSVDYGIFAIDAARFGTSTTSGTWSTILVAGITTFTGFAPLLFCRHGVLAQLGQVLSAGVIGTMIGAWWGVPSAVRWMREKGRT